LNGDFFDYIEEVLVKDLSFVRLYNTVGKVYTLDTTIDNIWDVILKNKEAASQFGVFTLMNGCRAIIKMTDVIYTADCKEFRIITLSGGVNQVRVK